MLRHLSTLAPPPWAGAPTAARGRGGAGCVGFGLGAGVSRARARPLLASSSSSSAGSSSSSSSSGGSRGINNAPSRSPAVAAAASTSSTTTTTTTTTAPPAISSTPFSDAFGLGGEGGGEDDDDALEAALARAEAEVLGLGAGAGASGGAERAGDLGSLDQQEDGGGDGDDDDPLRAAASGASGGAASSGAARAGNYRCLVLDAAYRPVNVVSWFRAVIMAEHGKVDVLDVWPGACAVSAYRTHPLPSVVRVRLFVDTRAGGGGGGGGGNNGNNGGARVPLTRRNVMTRDRHRCQYCGSTRELTLDHVTPVSKGGGNRWDNLVTACSRCNQRKGSATLSSLGWRLPGGGASLREPTPAEVGVVCGVSATDLEKPHACWEPFLAPYRDKLRTVRERQARKDADRAAASVGGGGGGGDHYANAWSSASSSSASGRGGSSRSGRGGRAGGGGGGGGHDGGHGGDLEAAVAAVARAKRRLR